MAVTVVANDTRTVRGASTAGTQALPLIEQPARIAPGDARELSRQFFERLAVLPEGTREYQYARNTLIEMNMSLVRFAARRFRNAADEMEDVIQVGMIGLIKAIDRFELSRETEFTTFAVPYIVGEMKRFFRDTTWAVHVPRRLQERRGELTRAREELEKRLERSPGVQELAALMGISEAEVCEAQVAANGYTSASLDAALSSDTEDGEAALADFIGAEDPAMELVEDFHALAPLMAELSDRERLLLRLRFGAELTQSQIGEELGISQMQVSRLLTRTVAKLRTGMLGAAAEARG
ncbi:SigB/SigF/SigG family RNA polymerase sigma factor [Streptomyces sp. NBC_00083]|uniref:SigB/SigF/SigG family RNA polymerase sigma factor n=1 Tax=Streptomyces sp. NBC_00083 TaxID=2975647 RepID=UPI0022537B40|nr:SigB/SigF/SigG family RNA polymerase sigma factor [Streptomyces sp. NBC_00083]MCX5384489.1 SigB/SigF/SigG family RNA polymerase sigma factor [Streptomyces sp. NBC_00083]